MRVPYYHLVIGLMILIAVSCKNEPGSNKTIIPRSPERIDTTAECQQAKTSSLDEIDKELKVIDFFGVKMHGKYEDIVNNIYMLPMLSCVERRDTIKLQGNGDKCFSHTVEFCGVPCGMNADFTLNRDKIMSINDLCFITSQTNDEIIHKFVSKLTKYYGEPDISDEREDSYHWYLSSGLTVRARHLHAPDGGWTVYFYIMNSSDV